MPRSGQTGESHLCVRLPASALLTVAVLIGAVGCGSSEGGDRSPEERFQQLERRLLAADLLRIEARLVSEGAFESELQGALDLAGPDRARSEFIGSFGGESVELALVSDGRSMVGAASGAESFRGDAPRHLVESFLVGMTRMGLLHNQAMLVGGHPPDRADGGVREWVILHDFHDGEREPGSGAEVPIRFSIQVDGRPSGRATLYLDPQTGLPVKREQTVVFGEDEMRVTETYTLIRLDPPPRPHVFEVPG